MEFIRDLIFRVCLKLNFDYFTKEKKPSDPTIAERFDTYRFADYKEQVIDLLERVTTVSVETMRILEKLKTVNEEHF